MYITYDKSTVFFFTSRGIIYTILKFVLSVFRLFHPHPEFRINFTTHVKRK